MKTENIITGVRRESMNLSVFEKNVLKTHDLDVVRTVAQLITLFIQIGILVHLLGHL